MIGLFDSGYGGLTILHGILAALPAYSYIYLGDNARAPYGPRSADEIYTFTRQGVEYLFGEGCDLVILACNTASANALRRLQQELVATHHPDKRILGILVPTIEQITGVAWKQTKQTVSASLGRTTVGVLATPATVASGAYPVEIHKRNPSITVIQQACPGLVEAIEAGESLEAIDSLLEKYFMLLEAQVSASASLSAVLLGCTHYALVANRIRNFLPPAVALYEQPSIVAKSLKKYLAAHPEIEQQFDRQGQQIFLTTGIDIDVSAHSSQYFGRQLTFRTVVIDPAARPA